MSDFQLEGLLYIYISDCYSTQNKYMTYLAIEQKTAFLISSFSNMIIVMVRSDCWVVQIPAVGA